MKRTNPPKPRSQSFPPPPFAPVIKIDATFLSINSTAYNVDRLSIQKGQKVKLQLDTPLSPEITWFADNDAVLDIDAHNNSAVIKGTQVGASRIELQINKRRVVRIIEIEVVPAAATKVKLVFGDPTHK